MPQTEPVYDKQFMLSSFIQGAFLDQGDEVILPVGNEGIQHADRLVLAGLLIAGAESRGDMLDVMVFPERPLSFEQQPLLGSYLCVKFPVVFGHLHHFFYLAGIGGVLKLIGFNCTHA